MRTISTCRSCQSSQLESVLNLGNLHLSAFVDPNEETPRYPLELMFCKQCKLVQLKHTVPPNEMYRNYWYRSGTNYSMTKELRDIARAASLAIRKEAFVALDIGCNDGTLLRAYDVARVTTVGFEPAKNLVPYAKKGTDEIVPDFFNANAWRERMGSQKADVVTTIAMFYDLDDPNEFVKDIAEVLSDEGVWIIQMADLKSMLDQTMWDNICHEHLEYYSLIALEHLLHSHDFYVQDVEYNDVNGGSMRVFVRKGRITPTENVANARFNEYLDRLDTVYPYSKFASRVEALTKELVDFVKGEVSAGKTVYAYGASTKGNTLLQYAGLDSGSITAAAERNPDKVGKFTVGTGIPIVSEETARNMKPDYFLVLPWHFLKEFIERESTFLKNGGKFIVPLPTFRIVSS